MRHSSSFKYVGVVGGRDIEPGVHKKVLGYVKSAKRLGFLADAYLPTSQSGLGHFKVACHSLVFSPDILIVRSNEIFQILLLPIYALRRLRRQITIIDVPTPVRAAEAEIKGKTESGIQSFLRRALMRLVLPISYWPVNAVIQYSDESYWYSFGVRHKTLLMGNGVDLDLEKKRCNEPPWPSNDLRLLGVARIKYWHGYDHVIRAIAKWHESNSSSFGIVFIVVGDGPELEVLKKLASELGVGARIQFEGTAHGSALDQYYETAHIGVASLGLARKDLLISSELKKREYLARGLPFIWIGEDPDFSATCDVAINLPSESVEEALLSFFRSLEGGLAVPHSATAREYAEQYLSYDVKLRQILRFVGYK